MEDEIKIHWKPQPKQEYALARNEEEILFGGSRGGGKTDAGQAFMMYDIDKSYYRGLVIRRNATDLDDWIDRAKVMYASAKGVFVGGTFVFPSGAKIRTGHLKDDNAYSKYQGHEYHKILIEELTHIESEDDYEKLRGSCRSKYPDIKPQIFATTNPDGAGHKWVKKRWRIPDHPTKPIITVDKNGLRRIFIPSSLDDNKKLTENDPNYRNLLEAISDEELKDAWLNGSWAGFGLKGAYYVKQLATAYREGRVTHVPYDLSLPVITWWDIGVGDSTTIGFFQKRGLQWCMIDFYSNEGEGLSHYVAVLQAKGYVYSDHYAPHDIEVKEFGTGKSRKEQAQSLGLYFNVAPRLSIEDGINAVRTRFPTLWIDETKCEKFLDAIKAYQKEWDEKNGMFKDKPKHDWASHTADMLRYWAVTNHVDPISYQPNDNTSSMR
ncbi:hypothetical protein E6Q11_04355 [Candidatus Dojkabacteria bacterium]|uniref:Uncharacterized protein n=1 Tax=Candidatus Dojkabacteria bacterium TaxID=2099670 RepID=A0A5C7J5Y5_9BACT|nr:MAG: hypothetical protein E6Q11_04355 [Candidatus Dojkabacteria bacterium]